MKFKVGDEVVCLLRLGSSGYESRVNAVIVCNDSKYYRIKYQNQRESHQEYIRSGDQLILKSIYDSPLNLALR